MHSGTVPKDKELRIACAILNFCNLFWVFGFIMLLKADIITIK